MSASPGEPKGTSAPKKDKKINIEKILGLDFISGLEGVLCWPDGKLQTPFTKKVEIFLYEFETFDPTCERGLLSWDEIKDKQHIACTYSDKDTGYFWFRKPELVWKDKENEILDVLGDKTEKEFWIAVKNCIILTPWGNDKVINIRGGGIFPIKICKKIEPGKSDRSKKVVTYIWKYERYPAIWSYKRSPNKDDFKDWDKMHMKKLVIPDEEPKDKVIRPVKVFYVIPFSKYRNDGTWNTEGFALKDEIKLMFNPTKEEEFPIIPSNVLDFADYPEKMENIYKSAVVDFYDFGARYNGQENKLVKFAYKQSYECNQIPFGDGVCYNGGSSRIKEFEFSYNILDKEKTTLKFYSPFKPQYTQNTPQGKNPQEQYDSAFVPRNILYEPLKHISGAVLKDNELLKYVLRDVGNFQVGQGYDANGTNYTHEYYSKGFTGGRFMDRRGTNPPYRMHTGLDMFNWLRATGTKGPANHAMCYGAFKTGKQVNSEGKLIYAGIIGNLVFKFPDGTSGLFQYCHMHSYNDNIKNGQFVFRGQLLGYAGDSGNAEGDPKTTSVTSKHTHLEFRVGNIRRNPAKIFLPNLYTNEILDADPNTINPDEPNLNEYRRNVHPKIKGNVKYPNGTNAGDVKIEVYDSMKSILYSRTSTRNNGNYIIPAPPENVVVIFSKDGYGKMETKSSAATGSETIINVILIKK